jgi:hypothetical protein
MEKSKRYVYVPNCMIEVSFGGKQAIRRWRKAPLELRRDVIGAPASESARRRLAAIGFAAGQVAQPTSDRCVMKMQVALGMTPKVKQASKCDEASACTKAQRLFSRRTLLIEQTHGT